MRIGDGCTLLIARRTATLCATSETLLHLSNCLRLYFQGNTWDSTLCPDPTTCAKNCALDGADYEGTYGIQSSGDSLSLTLKTGSNVGSRVYLLGPDGKDYKMFHMKNKEFTFDVVRQTYDFLEPRRLLTLVPV